MNRSTSAHDVIVRTWNSGYVNRLRGALSVRGLPEQVRAERADRDRQVPVELPMPLACATYWAADVWYAAAWFYLRAVGCWALYAWNGGNIGSRWWSPIPGEAVTDCRGDDGYVESVSLRRDLVTVRYPHGRKSVPPGWSAPPVATHSWRNCIRATPIAAAERAREAYGPPRLVVNHDPHEERES